jgi:nucleoid-associated protein YgaU
MCLLSAIRGETDPSTLAEPLYLPALLGDLTYSEEGGHQEYDTVRRGQFSQPEGGRGVNTAKKLMAASLDVYTTWEELGFMPTLPTELDPDDVRGQLLDLLRARRGFDLKVWRPGFDVAEINMSATLRDVNPTVKQGEAAARYITIEVKEWRDPTVDRRTSTESRKKGAKLPTTHALTGSDTWSSLAKEYYGSASEWRTIAQANGAASWGANTPLAAPSVPLSSGVAASTQLYAVGAVVRIPRKPAGTSGGTRPRA